ncbi:MAG: hypothetical protein QM752_02920 [Gammaproteobacteria bacterium]
MLKGNLKLILAAAGSSLAFFTLSACTNAFPAQVPPPGQVHTAAPATPAPAYFVPASQVTPAEEAKLAKITGTQTH